MKSYVLLLMVMAATASAQIIQLDFNDQAGNPSLVNRGSANVTFTFFGENGSGETPTFSQDVPSVNSGGYSAYFNQATPSSQYISGGSVPDLDNLVSMALTGWFFFQPVGEQPSTSPYYLISKSDAEDGQGFRSYRDSAGRLVFQAGGAGPVTFSESSTTPSEQWVFFAITLDASLDTDNLKLYIGDGETLSLADTQDYAIPDGNIGATDADLLLANPSRPNGGINARFDSFRICNLDPMGMLDLNQLESVMKFNDVIPEPKSIGMLSVGLIMLFLVCRKKLPRYRWRSFP